MTATPKRPEDPAEPESADVPAPFQRRRDDIAGHQEEEGHPGVAGEEPLPDPVLDVDEQDGAQVPVQDEQDGDPAEGVQPGHPRLARYPVRSRVAAGGMPGRRVAERVRPRVDRHSDRR